MSTNTENLSNRNITPQFITKKSRQIIEKFLEPEHFYEPLRESYNWFLKDGLEEVLCEKPHLENEEKKLDNEIYKLEK